MATKRPTRWWKRPSGSLGGSGLTTARRRLRPPTLEALEDRTLLSTDAAAHGTLAPDPKLFIPQNLSASPGATVTVPVQMLVTETNGIIVSDVDVAIGYDASKFTVSNPQMGSMLSPSTFDVTFFDTTSYPGEILLSAASPISQQGFANNALGAVFTVDFTVKSGAAAGPSPINLQDQFFDSSGIFIQPTDVLDNNLNALTLTPAPTNASNDPVDGIFTVGSTKPATTTTLSAAPNQSVYGQPVTFTAQVNGAGGTPTGTVTFLDGATALGTGTLSGGTATFTTSALAVAGHSITASYGGDTNFAASTSAALTQTINRDGTATAVTSSANPSVSGQSVAFTATVTASAPGAGTPTGTVAFKDGAATLGTANLSGGSASFSTSALAVAGHSITVSYGGDGNFTGSTSSALTQTVNRDATATTVASSANPVVSGQSVTFTATVSANAPGGGTPAGAVTFKDGATTLGTAALSGGVAAFTTSALAVGSHTITASYGGNANFLTSSGTVTESVGKDGTTTAVVASPATAVFSQAVTLTATVTANGPGSGTPTGTVTFMAGANLLGTVFLSGGSTSLTTSALAVGNDTITATYNGESRFTTSSGTTTEAVGTDGTTTTVTSFQDPVTYGDSVTFTATVTANAPGAGIPSGAVTFMDGTLQLGTVGLSGGSATFTSTSLTAGTHSITVRYAGDSNYTASDSGVLSQTVLPRTLYITANSTSETEGTALNFAGSEFTTAGAVNIAGLVNGDFVQSVTLTSAGAAAGAEDGSYAIVPSAAVGVGLSNYAITYVPGTLTVLEPAIAVVPTPLTSINEGDPSALVEVATFTHANGVEPADDFTATVNWGVAGHTADPGTILPGDGGTYHLWAQRPVFAEEATFSPTVTVAENDNGTANIAQNFSGVSLNQEFSLANFGFIPSDQGAAVGPDYYMQMVNDTYAIYHKDGTVAVPTTELSTFYVNAGLPDLGHTLTDPRLTYDPSSGRWFAVAITEDTASNDFVLAVSQTSDPTGAWKAVIFPGNNTANNFADFPTLGVDQNALYIGTNNFLDLNNFDGVSLTTFPKSDLLDPAGPNVANRTHFENLTGGFVPGATPFTLMPVTDFGSRDHGVVVAVDGFDPATVLHTYDVTNPATASSSLSPDNPLTVPIYYNSQLAHQPDGSQILDNVDYRIGSNSVYQVGNVIWVAQSVLPDSNTGAGAYDAIRWSEIDESTHTLLQSGTISDPHHDFIDPAIAANAAGDVVIGFSATGDSTTTDFPGAWFVSGTTSGGVTSFGSPQVLRNGSSNYDIEFNTGSDRWGDFSAISVDPTNPNAFWITEQTAVPGDPNVTIYNAVWGTQTGELVFGNSASATSSLTVNEPPVAGTSAALAPVVTGQTQAAVEVATFTHANGVEPAGDFTATVDWGISGHTADVATVTEDGGGTYNVSAAQPAFVAGTYSVTVTIGEDNASTSVTDNQVVNPAGTSTGVSATPTTSVYGQSVTFTATLSVNSPGAGTPTGTVTFTDGSTTLGTAPLSGGTATFTTSALAVGGHTITAGYGGDANFTGSTSDALTQTVNPDATGTALASSANPSVYGQSVTFTATVTANAPGSGTPTGTVAFFDGSTELGTGTLTGGVATYSTAALSVAGYSITAVYDGSDPGFSGSTSAALSQTVNRDATATSVVSSADPSTYGDAVTLTATVMAVAPGAGTPSGAVTFLDGATVLGTATLSGGTATFTTAALAAGSPSITASYGGDNNFGTSTSDPLTQSVGTRALMITADDASKPEGTALTFAETEFTTSGLVNDDSVTGVTLTSAGAAATAEDGIYSIAVSAATGTGLSNYSITYQPGTLTVTEPAIVGASAALPALVTGQASAAVEVATFTHAGSVEPAGDFAATVNWGVAGHTADLAIVTEDGSGIYHVSAGRPVFTGGTYTVTVSIGEDNASTTVTDSQAVNPDATTTAVTSSANPSALGSPLTFTATVSAKAPGGGTPTGTVTFKDGATTLGTGTLSGGTATFTTSGLAFGSHAITASYGGDGNYTTSSSAVLTQAVKIGTSTVVASSVNPSVFGHTVTFTATVTPASGTATPTGTVTFFDGTAALGTGTLSTGKATFSISALAVAGHAITAGYGGDGTFMVSTSPVLTQTVNVDASKTATTLSANTAVYGQSVTFTATVTAASPGAGTPSGTVTFLDGTTTLGTANLVGGLATFSATALAVGSHAIAANYGGDSNFAASASSGKALTVNPDGTTTTLAASPNPSTFGQSVTFTATVTANAPGGGVPGGTVTFKDGKTTLGTAILNVSGVAIFTTSSLSLGSHAITAGYGASVNYKTSTSAALTQVVNATGAAAIPAGPAASPSTASPNSLAASVVRATTPTGAAPAGSTSVATVGTPAAAGAAPSPLVAQGTTSVSTDAVAAGPSAAAAGTGSGKSRTAKLDLFFAAFGKGWSADGGAGPDDGSV
jgi:hypothetical protein